MEISAKHDATGEYQLEVGPVQFALNKEAINALYHVIDKRLSEGDKKEAEALHRKLSAYRDLATKMGGVGDKVVQKFVTRVSPEQLVTMVRLADGQVLYNKVLRNLSKQNRRQFEEDYETMNRITEHQAVIYMEQIIPIVKQAAEEQKKLQAETSS